MSRLNERQADAVHDIDGPMLVLAGAGSGKTSVITRKIAWLIQDCGYQARHIVALTFTNKAAREMKTRVAQLVQGKAARGLTVSTFHTLGLNMLRRETAAAGLKPNFTLFDQADSLALIKDILTREFPNDIDQAGHLQNLISNWKNDLRNPAQARSYARNADEELAAQVYEHYARLLSAYNAVDFDDLIRRPAELLQQNAELRERWQKRIRYLLVDEYQDTNSSQYELVKLLVGDHPRFTVVGDDDQSIYSWRGARPENLAQLQEDYPNLRVVKLEQNYRSTGRILKAANHLIDHNPHVFQKRLWSDMGYGEPIRIIRTANEEQEIDRVVTEIITNRLHHKLEHRDFAVLYRGNHQSRLLELKLQEARIPYKLSGGTSFFARAEIKDVMAYLRLLINPDDDAAFLRIINTPRREIGAATLEKLGLFCGARHVSLYQGAGDRELDGVLSGRALMHLHSFVEWLDDKRHKLSVSAAPVDIIRELLFDIDYESWLRQEAGNARAAEKRMANVWQLIDSLQGMLDRGDEQDDSEVAIEDAITRLVLRDMLERQEEEAETNAVQLMTLHAAKGLEFPRVFMIGLEEELLPHRNSIESDDIEEERRLMYVGITRAQRALTITYAARRRQFGEIVDCMPSRFLQEMPQDDLVWEGLEAPTQQESRAARRSTLDSLYAMLDD
ncbi:DNA helicase Rep [Natronospirillum operosum]|uniref:ATP-dependent DNA helicase Rep n=1 Tax=Natronospirillum operosum TaxID=2759953 RepID=A0A4Z0W2Z8_9GAMM|nr:DNA helicase Rep [Natronospirillum operosum]TGG91359.1 DNA helicase Rep [Natronospirillum operosum]